MLKGFGWINGHYVYQKEVDVVVDVPEKFKSMGMLAVFSFEVNVVEC